MTAADLTGPNPSPAAADAAHAAVLIRSALDRLKSAPASAMPRGLDALVEQMLLDAITAAMSAARPGGIDQ
jgi:hypothetical protein